MKAQRVSDRILNVSTVALGHVRAATGSTYAGDSDLMLGQMIDDLIGEKSAAYVVRDARHHDDITEVFELYIGTVQLFAVVRDGYVITMLDESKVKKNLARTWKLLGSEPWRTGAAAQTFASLPSKPPALTFGDGEPFDPTKVKGTSLLPASAAIGDGALRYPVDVAPSSAAPPPVLELVQAVPVDNGRDEFEVHIPLDLAALGVALVEAEIAFARVDRECQVADAKSVEARELAEAAETAALALGDKWNAARIARNLALSKVEAGAKAALDRDLSLS